MSDELLNKLLYPILNEKHELKLLRLRTVCDCEREVLQIDPGVVWRVERNLDRLVLRVVQRTFGDVLYLVLDTDQLFL